MCQKNYLEIEEKNDNIHKGEFYLKTQYKFEGGIHLYELCQNTRDSRTRQGVSREMNGIFFVYKNLKQLNIYSIIKMIIKNIEY